MAFAYLVISTFPFWAIPIGLLLIEQGVRCRSRRYHKRANFAFFCAFIFLVGSGIFFYLGGHKNVAPAFKAYREGQLNFSR